MLNSVNHNFMFVILLLVIVTNLVYFSDMCGHVHTSEVILRGLRFVGNLFVLLFALLLIILLATC